MRAPRFCVSPPRSGDGCQEKMSPWEDGPTDGITGACGRRTAPALLRPVSSSKARLNGSSLEASPEKAGTRWLRKLKDLVANVVLVPKGGSLPLATEVGKRPYKTEIIGGVVVQTPISGNQNGGEACEGSELAVHPLLRRSQSHVPTTKTPAGPPVLKSGYCVKQGNVRKSWKRRYFALDDFSISYFKCEQDKDPLRTILLKGVLKAHECLVKSGDLLMRDNLFEIITSYRTFYVQAYSPEDMHSWVEEITRAVQALKSCPREMPLVRSASVNKHGGPSLPGPTASSITRPKPPTEGPKAAGKGPATSCWLPWVPVPKSDSREPAAAGEPASEAMDLEFAPAQEGRGGPARRLRHMSEPQNLKEHPFPFDLDDETIRTSDV